MEKQKEIYRIVEILETYIIEESHKKLPVHIAEAIGKIQEDAFMEGYQYAIAILEDGIPKKNRKF